MFAALVFVFGCDPAHPSLGACDTAAALEVVYSPAGVPAFAGQALTQISCGNGGFCHTEEPSDGNLDNRFGAPAGLHFDVRIASIDIEINEEAALRLGVHQLVVLGNRNNMYAQVSARRMPPPGQANIDYRLVAGVDSVQFERVMDDGVTFVPLPDIGTDAGEEIFRNWLACDVPVVERTLPRIDLEDHIGFVAPTCVRGCVDPTWPAIYEEIIVPSCARSRCHGSDEPTGRLVLDNRVQDATMPVEPARAAAHAQLVGQVARSSICEPSGLTLITAGDSASSLMYDKLSAPTSDDTECGSVMPVSGTRLTTQQLCAVREWIDCGACADPADAACMACTATARATCNVDTAEDNNCDASLTVSCSSSLP